MPSVLREQACVSVCGAEAVQAPPAHVYSVHVWLCVPELPHVPAKPVHAPNPLHDVALQLVPSVVREQPCVSVRIAGMHAPPWHVRSVHVRLCEPAVAHVSAKPPHAP